MLLESFLHNIHYVRIVLREKVVVLLREDGMYILAALRYITTLVKRTVLHRRNSRYTTHMLGLLLLFVLVGVEFLAFDPASVYAYNHTASTVSENCQTISYSPDGNPFPLCPGPYPTGGNCVWWAWEQWHLLGYNLPLNWGNAADWIVDAEHVGLPIGTTPRVGSIAVFPRADGVWAYGIAGHVAFVTSVSADGTHFDVTYQNYGDATHMYTGTGYAVSVINEPRYQNGSLRFLYFPQEIHAQKFASLPGVQRSDPTAISSANTLLSTSSLASSETVTPMSSSDTTSATPDRIALGITPLSSGQEFNADFTGTGVSDLLLYNRPQGQLDVLTLQHMQPPSMLPQHGKHLFSVVSEKSSPQLIPLSDATTGVNQWGSSLEVHVGTFTGTKKSDILLYDREAGTIHLITLNTQRRIEKHVVFSGWGTGWELYVGQFDGTRSGVFLYKRFARQDTIKTPITTPSVSPSVTPDAPLNTTPVPFASSTPHTKPSPPPTTTVPSTPTFPSTTPTSTPSPTTAPSATATQSPSPTPTVVPSPTPAISPTPTVLPSPTPTLSPSPTPTISPSPTATPSVGVTPTTLPSPTATPTSIPTPSATPTSQESTPSATPTKNANISLLYNPLHIHGALMQSQGGSDLSGDALAAWERQGRTANIVVMDFNPDLTLHVQQDYTLWHANWEVSVGRFAGPSRDAIFLYDRITGESRLLDFNANLFVDHYQRIRGLKGNWSMSSGDFAGKGRSQLLLYDPSTGNARMLLFAKDLSPLQTQTYSGWATNAVVYVGHFGMPSVSIMLYSPQESHSFFVAFDASLHIVHQYTVHTWGPRWQILVGSFLDRAKCLQERNCSTGDDLLILDRQTGHLEQFVFSFGRAFKVFDNRTMSFIRNGVAADVHPKIVDTTTFDLLQSLDTTIRGEEIY